MFSPGHLFPREMTWMENGRFWSELRKKTRHWNVGSTRISLPLKEEFHSFLVHGCVYEAGNHREPNLHTMVAMFDGVLYGQKNSRHKKVLLTFSSTWKKNITATAVVVEPLKAFLGRGFRRSIVEGSSRNKNPHPRSVFLSGLSSRASVIQQFGIEAKMHGCAMGRNRQEDNFQHDRIILFNNHFTCLNQYMTIVMNDYKCQ